MLEKLKRLECCTKLPIYIQFMKAINQFSLKIYLSAYKKFKTNSAITNGSKSIDKVSHGICIQPILVSEASTKGQVHNS